MREELVLTFGGPVGSRRSTTDRASAYQLEPMPNLPPELRRRDTYCEWYDLATSATTSNAPVTGGVICGAPDLYGCQRASKGIVYT